MKSKILIVAMGLVLSGCMSIVSQGEVGVRDTLGAQSKTISEPGLKLMLWPVWDITKVSVQITNLKVTLSLPSKEGLTIASEVSILYRIMPEKVPAMLRDIGQNYERRFILPVFRSAVADITAQYAAKDMHSGKRSEIENAVQKMMNSRIKERGFVIEAVLLKSIRLPHGLSRSIEDRLRAEQRARQMVYVLQRERKEAERRIIEAKGIRDANIKLSEGLSPAVLRYKAIEALRKLAKSPNAKLVITSSDAPLNLGGMPAISVRSKKKR
jgi:regulator of protease activity HflC (stomatin/prohibitin superfamily)